MSFSLNDNFAYQTCLNLPTMRQILCCPFTLKCEGVTNFFMALKKIKEVGKKRGLPWVSDNNLTCMMHKSVIICRQVNYNCYNVSQRQYLTISWFCRTSCVAASTCCCSFCFSAVSWSTLRELSWSLFFIFSSSCSSLEA